MADISNEVNALRNAEYGEEVRSAFISCMEKIHEENESYNSMKNAVATSEKEVKKQVVDMGLKNQQAQKILDDYIKTVDASKAQKTALENTMSAAQTRQNSLQKVIDTCNDTESDINKSVASANAAARAAQNAVELIQEQSNSLAFRINPVDKGLDVIIMD